MAFWDGTSWVAERATTEGRERSRTRDWIATAVMVIGLVALMIPFSATMAASNRPHGNPSHDPAVTAGCESAPCPVGDRLIVSGHGFSPSSGGQQMYLWIGYPDDYCGSGACHGFYAYPWVGSDGSFDVGYDNATLQTGTGEVKGFQYNVRRGKWEVVALTYFTVQ